MILISSGDLLAEMSSAVVDTSIPKLEHEFGSSNSYVNAVSSLNP